MEQATGDAREDDRGWDIVIGPALPWWRLDLKGVWDYRDLLLLLVRRDLLAVYKQTILGPLWQVVQPLLTSITFAVVFGLVARMSVPGVPDLLFYMAALVPWMLFANVINRVSGTLLWNAPLMTKVYFPRLVAPVATMLSTSVSFLVQLASFFVFGLAYRWSGAYPWHAGPELLLLPLLVLMLVMLAFGLGLMVAGLTTKFRDLTFLTGFGVQLLMFLSPVIFPLSRVEPGSRVRMVLELNPMSPIIEGFRAVLLGTPMDWSGLWYAAVCATLSLFAGLALFQRVERFFADVV